MNARESLEADAAANAALQIAEETLFVDPHEAIARYVRVIALELRAARVYANYLEGRDGARRSDKREKAASS